MTTKNLNQRHACTYTSAQTRTFTGVHTQTLSLTLVHNKTEGKCPIYLWARSVILGVSALSYEVQITDQGSYPQMFDQLRLKSKTINGACKKQ